MKFLARLTRWLYRLARLSNNARVITSGSPRKVMRHEVNKEIGKRFVRRIWWR
jgi:hypothetical protein